MKLERGKRGDVLILVIGLLALLLAITIAFLALGRTGFRISHYSLHEVKAREMAETGMAEALARLKSDAPESDSHDDNWRRDFTGDEVDNNGDGGNESRWIVIRRQGRLVGRYAVLVEDESAAVNLNAAGNLSRAGGHGWHQGWRSHEIDPGKLPGLGTELAAAICRVRYGRDGRPGGTGDDDDDRAILADDGIDNDGDGLVDEPDEGTEEPDEFDPEEPAGDDEPFRSPDQVREIRGLGPAAFRAIRGLVSIFSRDWNRDRSGRNRIPVNRASPVELSAAFAGCGFESDRAVQLAVNLVDYRDRDSLPTGLAGPDGRLHLGLEQTPYLNELELAPAGEWRQRGDSLEYLASRGEFIELFNPYDRPLPIGGWRVKGGNLPPVTIRANAVIPARSYYTIGDSRAVWIRFQVVAGIPVPVPVEAVSIRLPANADQHQDFLWLTFPGAELRLEDATGRPVEITRVGFDFPGQPTRQKNDPRMRGENDWYPGPPSPGRTNQLFLPESGLETTRLEWTEHFQVKNRPLATVGELGRLHRMEGWRTLDLTRPGRPDLKTQDIFTAAEPLERPTAGRININTAPPEVLNCLPSFDAAAATAVIEGRPYPEIGSVAPRLAYRSRPGADLEERYRRISNLVTVRSSIFRITVTGQSVEDLNENGIIEENEVETEKRLTAVFDRDRPGRRFIYWKED